MDIVAITNGILAGLVSITAGADSITPSTSILVGAVGGGQFVAADALMKYLHIDDCVGAKRRTCIGPRPGGRPHPHLFPLHSGRHHNSIKVLNNEKYLTLPHTDPPSA